MTPRPEKRVTLISNRSSTSILDKAGSAPDIQEQHGSNIDGSTATIVVQPDKSCPPHVICQSTEPFVNPTCQNPTKSAKEINESLNLNLGMTRIDPNNVMLRKVLKWISQFLLMWWEQHFFKFWDKVPLAFRQKLTFWSWKMYLPLHKYLLGRKTGIHPDVSLEYHALTTVMWWGRLFPVTVERMRFALSQLYVCHPRPTRFNKIKSDIVPIQHDMTDFLSTNQVDCQDACLKTTVSGYHVQNHTATALLSNPKEKKVIFWLYGGAYLAGDAKGNSTIAEAIGLACNADVFLPNFGLMPECSYNEILWDVMLGYAYLVFMQDIDPSDIIMWGISSGGGLVTRALQAIVEVKREQDLECPYIESLLVQCMKKKQSIMPSGGVLLCPFVDYTDSKGAFEEYPAHDLIVNQSVIEVGVPYFQIKLGSMESRRRTSPVYRNFEGLPPLCVVLSEHEVIYDQAVQLVNNARCAGVQVTVGVWKYLCHVFCFLSTFIPEGEQAMDFCCDWIRQSFKTSATELN